MPHPTAPPLTPRGLGRRVRELRQSLGVSQRELARSAGIVHSQLSRIEAGKTDPSVSALTKLAFALDVPLCGFMGDETTSAADAANGASALTEAEEEILTLYRAASPVDRTQVERLLLLMVGRLAATSSRGRPGLGGAWRRIAPTAAQEDPSAVGPAAYQIFVVADDGLTSEGIKVGDMVAAHRGQAKEGDVVVVEVAKTGPIVRLYYPRPGNRVQLRPAHPELKPMVVSRRAIHSLWIATHVRAS